MKILWRFFFVVFVALFGLYLYDTYNFAHLIISTAKDFVIVSSFGVSVSLLVMTAGILTVNAVRLGFVMKNCVSDATIGVNVFFTSMACLSIFFLATFRDTYEEKIFYNGYAPWFDQYGLLFVAVPFIVTLISWIVYEANYIKNEHQRYKHNLKLQRQMLV